MNLKSTLKRFPVVHRLARKTYLTSQQAMVKSRSSRISRTAIGAFARLIPAMTPRHVADVAYAAVLDGSTLNLDLIVPFDGRVPKLVTIVFRNRQAILAAPARIRAIEGGLLRVSATISMGSSNIPVQSHRAWRLGCVVDGVEHALRGAPRLDWPAGPTIAEPPCRETGNQYQIGTGRAGLTTLTVKQPRRIAEVVDLELSWSAAKLRVRTVGFTCDRAAIVRLTSRDGSERLEAPITMDGDEFTCVLPVAQLVREVSQVETTWDINVLTADGRVRVGRTLHELSNPKIVLRPQAKVVASSVGSAVRIRPYFTPAGKLALACLLVGRPPVALETRTTQ